MKWGWVLRISAYFISLAETRDSPILNNLGLQGGFVRGIRFEGVNVGICFQSVKGFMLTGTRACVGCKIYSVLGLVGS